MDGRAASGLPTWNCSFVIVPTAWFMYMSIRIDNGCERAIVKSIQRITNWHYEASRMLTNSARDIFFYPILTRTMDYFSCSPLNISFYI